MNSIYHNNHDSDLTHYNDDLASSPLSVPYSLRKVDALQDTTTVPTVVYAGRGREGGLNSLSTPSVSFITTEPGYYEDGKFGIRIENVVEIVPTTTKVRVPSPQFLCDDLYICLPRIILEGLDF